MLDFVQHLHIQIFYLIYLKVYIINFDCLYHPFCFSDIVVAEWATFLASRLGGPVEARNISLMTMMVSLKTQRSWV